MKKWLLLIPLLISFFPSRGQEPSFKRYTDIDGLISEEVFDLLQDKRGFIWIGTEKGLCRFDGIRFQSFLSPDQQSLAVSDIRQDAFGTIWCTNFSGQIFFIQEDSLFEFRPFRNLHNGVVKYCFDATGESWYAGTNKKGIFKFDIRRLKSTLFMAKDSAAQEDISAIALAEPSGMDLIYTIGNRVTKYTASSYRKIPEDVFSKNRIWPQPSLMFNWEEKAYIYFTVSDDLYQLQDKDALLVKENLFGEAGLGYCNTISVLDKQRICLNSTSGCRILDKNFSYLSRPLFRNQSITDLLIDHEGNYWFSSNLSGLMFCSNIELTVFRAEESQLPYNEVSAIKHCGNGLLLIGFRNGNLCLFDPARDQLLHEYRMNLPKPITEFILSPEGDGFYAYNSTLEYFKFDHSAHELLFGGIRKIHLSASGRSFLAMSNISSVLNDLHSQSRPEKFWSDYYPIDSFQSFSQKGLYRSLILRRARANDIVADTSETLVYVAYTDGLFVHDSLNSRPLLYQGERIHANCLLLQADLLICGTVQDGIYFIRNDSVVKRLNKENGLSSNFIRRLFIHQNQLCIIHSQGFDRYDLFNDSIRHYNLQDGLNARDYFCIEFLNGNYYLGSNRGISCLPEQLSGTNPLAPRLYLGNLIANGKRLTPSEGLQIPYEDRNLSLSFTSISYRSQKNYQVSYRLVGQGDSNWIYINPEISELRFPSLNPGQYLLQIKAVNEEGAESDIQELSFRIKSPFWQQWWFWALLAIPLLLLVILVYQWRLKEQMKKNKLALEKMGVESDLRESEMASLKVQMNPHFIFNALNSIQEFILTNEKKSANLYLGKFSDLMRMTLDMSREKSVSLKEELKVLHLYLELENLRLMNEMQYRIDCEGIDRPEAIQIPSMLIQPYVENAIKHGLLHRKNEKNLKITFSLKHNSRAICVMIEDNGIGRQKAAELSRFRPSNHKSFGSSATQKRLELLNHGRSRVIAVVYHDLFNTKGEACGTRVEIEIPLIEPIREATGAHGEMKSPNKP